MNHKHNFWLALFFASIATLNGCSSGSGSGSNDTDNDNEIIESEAKASSTVSGSAVKGLMSFAPVSVFPVTDGIIGSTSIAEGETDADGIYQLNLVDYSGPVQLQISIDDDTLMICDAFNGCGAYTAEDELDLNLDLTINFGDKYHPTDPDFILTALVPNVETGVITPVQITPLTHAAAEYAASSGASLDANSINEANLQLASVLGLTINILSVAPVDIASIPANSADGNIEYAALLASLASMASEQGISDSGMIAIFVDAFVNNDGQFIQNSATPSVFTLEALYDNAGAALTAATPSSDTSLAIVQAEIEQNGNVAGDAPPDTATGVDIPAIDEDEPVNAVDSAKALISDVRTWGNVIEQEADGPLRDLEEHAQSIGESLELAMNDLQLKQGMLNLFSQEDGSEGHGILLIDALKYSIAITEAVLEDGQTETIYNIEEEIPGLDSNVYEDQEVTLSGQVHVNRTLNTVDFLGTQINGQLVNIHLESSDLDSESTTDAFIRFNESELNEISNPSAHMAITGGASATTNIAVNLNIDVPSENVELGVLSVEVTVTELTGSNPSKFTGTLASVISRDLAELNAAVDEITLTGIPNLDQFPGIPNSIQTDLYSQHLLRATGVAEGTDELLDGIIFWAASAEALPETAALEEDNSEFDVNFASFNFTGELSNGLGDSFNGEFEFQVQKQLLDNRRNVAALSFIGNIAAKTGDSFEGSFNLEGESPLVTTGEDAGTVALDDEGNEIFNLSHVSLSGGFDFSTGESMLASAVATSNNAGTFIPDPENDESENNFRNLDLALCFNAQLTGLPLARFTLSSERTGYKDGIGNIDISYGGAISEEGEFSGAARRIQLELDSQQALDDITSNRIIISNEAGVTLSAGVTCEDEETQEECEEKLDEEGTHGIIMVGDEKVADLDLVEDNWLIRYTDGTFESLF